MNTAGGFVSTPNYQLILGGVIFTIVILIIFNIRQLKNIITKATDLIANVINAVFTVFSSIADAVKSAAYYSLVIRMMLFPSFNKRTNNMVLRLTILFLSITSFITTYQSMSDALNETVALLLTFCIQSLIVVFSIHIGHGFEPFDAGRQKPQGSAGHTGDRNKKARKIIRIILAGVSLAACLGISIWFSWSYIVNQIKANAVFSKNNYFSVLDEFSSFMRAVEQQGNGVKDAAVQELETANLNLESMRAKISLKLNDHTDVIEELAEEKNIWLGTGNGDGVQAQAEEQIAAMREYILSFKNPNQAEIVDFNISSYLTAVENVTRIYAAIPTLGNEEEYFSAEQNAQLIADTYAVRQILEWEMTWKRVYRDPASKELGFMETEDLIEKVKDIQNERGLLYRLLTGDIENYEPKKKQLHTLYRENTEALIYGIEDYIVEIPPEVSANLDNKIDAMTGTVTRQKQNIGEVVNSPLVLTQNNAFSQKEVIDEGATEKQINTDEKDSNSGGLILAIAIMIDGLIVALCFIVGKSSINDQIENQRVLMRALLIPEQKKETETAQSMLIISVVLAGIVLIPLSFISALAIGWLLLIGAILTGIFNVILTGTEMVSSRPWFRKLVNRYFVTKPDAVENISAGFSDTFIRLIKDITALDEADFDGAEKAFKQEVMGKVSIANIKQAAAVAKILELNCLAMVKGDTVYLKKRFFCILSEFVIGLHRELEPMVAELVRLTIIQISDEDEKNECIAEDKQKS